MPMFISLVLLSLLSQSVSAAEDTSEINLDYCHVPNFSEEVLCGQYSVEENRRAPNGRKIDIKIAVMPAYTEAKELDPLVLFAGGPGQGARAMVTYVERAFKQVRETRDIVLIDQRGMGDSNPLACEMPDVDLMTVDEEELREISERIVRECPDKLDADVTLYTQDLANEDIYDITMALGYDSINIYGASWGTRSALLYANQFPEQVRSIVVDGTAPLSNKVPLYFSRDAQQTLNFLFKDCAADAKCNEAFPELETRFNDYLNNFPDEGLEVKIADPNTGKVHDVTMKRDTIVSVLRTILYSPNMTRMLPVIMGQIFENDFRGMAGVISAVGDAGMTIGATLTILCAEEYSRFSEAEQLTLSIDSFENGSFARQMRESCALWPKAPLPDLYKQELVQQQPTLILSGMLDPVTPPFWGEAMKQHFPNSSHLVAPNTGHNVAPVGCSKDIIADFINAASYEELDASCLDDIKRPSFFLNTSGPVGSTEE